jgi:hypothetical protein
MDKDLHHLNAFLRGISHNYVLIIIGAVIFFAIKAVAGWITYRKFKNELKQINESLTKINQKLSE